MATEEEYNEQLAAALTEGTGTTITAGHLSPTDASNRLSAGEVQRRFELGLPINEGEMFPAIPEGITAWDYYKYSNIPAPMTAFSTTFSNFENSIALNPNPQGANTVSDQQKIDDSIQNSSARVRFQQMGTEATTGSDDWSEGAGAMAMAGISLNPMLGISGMIAQIMSGTPFLDYGHMLGQQSGGTAHNTSGFNREHNGQTISMNETLWRQWDSLEEGQKDLLASGVIQMFQGKDGKWHATNGKRVKNKDDKWEMVKLTGGDLDTHVLQTKATRLGYGGRMSPGFNQWGIMGAQDISDAAHRNIISQTYYNLGADSKNRAAYGDNLDYTSYFGAGQSSDYMDWDWSDVGTGDEGKFDYSDTSAGQGWIQEEVDRQALGAASTYEGKGWSTSRRYEYTSSDPSWTSTYDTSKEGLSKSWITDTGPDEDPQGSTTAPQSWDAQAVAAQAVESGGYDAIGTADPGPEAQSAWDTAEGSGYHGLASGGPVGMQEGGMPMPPPQEGMEAPMPMPQEGAAADMANLGMINEQAAPPQEGGQASVEDDVPREADEGDYILPYETVLLVGLKQLNRYAREAIKLAMKNDIDLGGTDLDPTDDVPIKVSNYEFHIPKVLVPFFGGGKKYLDKIREEGLALRKRLEEEKQPSAQEQQQQQPQPTAQPAPPQLEAAPAAPPQAAPQMPMMQKGGFVSDPNEEQQSAPTTAAVLEGDTSQQTTAYNQLKALQHSKKTQQQPPMVDPTGKVIPQGFAAPQGYQDGTSEGGVQKGEIRKIFSYDFNIIEDEEFKGESGTNVDFLHPDEPQNSSGMPTIIIKDRAKLEEQVGDIDNFLKGEALHYLASVDPKYSGLRDSYKKSLTSGQKAMDKSAFERAKQQGESRPFSKWMETHRLDAHIRGALYQDTKDEWAGTYTPEQNQILETIKNHLSNLETGPVEQPSQPELVEPVTDVLPPPQEDILPLPEEKEEADVPTLPVEEAGIPTLPAERQPGFAQQPMIA